MKTHYSKGQLNPTVDRKKISQSCNILNSHTIKHAIILPKCFFAVLQKKSQLTVEKQAGFSQPLPALPKYCCYFLSSFQKNAKVSIVLYPNNSRMVIT
jgi:hypothetical protein